MLNWHIRKGYGQLFVGALVWLFYFAFVGLLTALDIQHLIAEIVAIPLSWIVNYNLNRYYNFEVAHSPKRFIWFISISGLSWVPFLATSYVAAGLGYPLIFGYIIGIAFKTALNVLLQQTFTFKDAKHADGSA